MPSELLLLRWSRSGLAALFVWPVLRLLVVMLLELVPLLPIADLVITGTLLDVAVVSTEEKAAVDEFVVGCPIVDVAAAVVAAAAVVVVAVVVVNVTVSVAVAVVVVVVEEVVVISLVVVINGFGSPDGGQHCWLPGQQGIRSDCPMQVLVSVKNGTVQ